MDHIAAAEEQIVTERIKRKFEEVNAAAQSQLSPIQDHINFTLQYSDEDRTKLKELIAGTKTETMDHMAVAEEQIVLERIRRKIEQVKASGQSQLSPIQEHISFTLQQAYFKCANACFEKRRTQEVTTNCVELCRVPVVNSQQRVDIDMAKFQEKMNRSLMVCQDKFEAAKLLSVSRIDAAKDLEDCVTDAAAALLGN